MNPTRSSPYDLPANSAQPVEATQTAAATPSSRSPRSLTSTMISDHTIDSLNAKEVQGSERVKTLARFAKEAIVRGILQRSPNQHANGVAQFGMSRNQEVLVIQAKLNECSEYDVLSVSFRREFEAPISMTLHSQGTAVSGSLAPACPWNTSEQTPAS